MANIFALYYKGLTSQMTPGETVLHIMERPFLQRAMNVLRLKSNDNIQLFDEKQNALLKVVGSEPQRMILQMLTPLTPNKKHYPRISLYIGQLKKSNEEEVLRISGSLGIDDIFPIDLAKSQVRQHQQKLKDKKIKDSITERQRDIIISGMEQARQFNFPVLHPVMSFDKFILGDNSSSNSSISSSSSSSSRSSSNITILLEEYGERNVLDMFNKLKEKGNDPDLQVNVLIGPEADFTIQEKEEIRRRFHPLLSIRLTPTTLTSINAVTIFTGIIRSYFNNLPKPTNEYH